MNPVDEAYYHERAMMVANEVMRQHREVRVTDDDECEHAVYTLGVPLVAAELAALTASANVLRDQANARANMLEVQLEAQVPELLRACRENLLRAVGAESALRSVQELCHGARLVNAHTLPCRVVTAALDEKSAG